MACDIIVDHYDETNHDNYLPINGIITSIGQCFMTPEGQEYEVCMAEFYLRRKGQPDGWIWAELRDITGTCGTDCVPTGEQEEGLLCWSMPIDAMSVSGIYSLHTFEFTKFPCPCLLPNHCYAIVLNSWGSFDVSNLIEVGVDLSEPTHAGNLVMYSSGSWSAHFYMDTIFYVWGEKCGDWTPPEGGGNAPVSPIPSQMEIQKYFMGEQKIAVLEGELGKRGKGIQMAEVDWIEWLMKTLGFD